MTKTATRDFSFGPVILSAFLPTLLFSTGEGAIIPMIPVVADDLGATLAIAGFISAMIMVGELCGDIPSGWVVSRIGERMSMIWASLLSIVGLVVCLATTEWWGLLVGVFLIGISTAVFALARQAFMTTYVPLAYRARALSTLGGVFRAGWFVGPLISAAVVHLTGTAQSAFWICIVGCLGAAVVLLLVADPSEVLRARRAEHGTAGAPAAGTDASTDASSERSTDASAHDAASAAGTEGAAQAAARTTGLFRTIAEHASVLARMGTGAALIGGLRSSRTVILPLWAVSIGISEPNTALIIGIAGAVDFALFYVSGQIMDRFGRVWSAIPSMIGLGLGHLVLAFTHDLPDAAVWFIVVAMFLSLANGIGSGILMTLGADLAPRNDPAPFLGAYRFTGDAGNAAAPLVVAGVTAVASISFASGFMGLVGLLGAGLLARWIPRYAPHRPRPRP